MHAVAFFDLSSVVAGPQVFFPSLAPDFWHSAVICLLRIRVEARANILERAVIEQQLQFMQMRVQLCPTEDTRTADTSCFSRTSAEHIGDSPVPVEKDSVREPDPMRPS